MFVPLQVADLYAYALRQNAERYFKNKLLVQPRLLDLILEKNRHDMTKFAIHPQSWELLMREVIKHFREWKKTNDSRNYRPLIHCPLLQTK